MYYNLECRYDRRKSFYGKAVVYSQKNSIEQVQYLFSYGTTVASIVNSFIEEKKIYRIYNYEINGKNKTQTTTRHQKEFFRQNGLSDKEIKELFDKGVLEYEL